MIEKRPVLQLHIKNVIVCSISKKGGAFVADYPDRHQKRCGGNYHTRQDDVETALLPKEVEDVQCDPAPVTWAKLKRERNFHILCRYVGTKTSHMPHNNGFVC